MTKKSVQARGGNSLVQFAPDINSGKAWSQLDLQDLKACSELGDSVADTALFLCRSKEETRAKAEELGIRLHWLNAEQKEQATKRYREKKRK